MDDSSKHHAPRNSPKIKVEGSSIEDVLAALKVDQIQREQFNIDMFPDKLSIVMAGLADMYRGVERATKEDSNGQSLGNIQKYANMEELSREEAELHLKILENYGLIVQAGNRWRVI